ncbi:hypothetical protein B0T10DRAFT_465717 [Thelonectria olida]|uniref:Uncharacterized protein n=1 Tax=Thelonectria olida TaxID=1576542 RepID=A0A9P8VSL9_9HYPO|nr:hypothetical protein B0T10DRAFT_465717 [Thelonectria olida]
MPKKLPTILELGTRADNVTFRMFCSDFQVAQNVPSGGFSPGSWNVWSQASGSPWYVVTSVDMINTNVDGGLSTTYFNQQPLHTVQILDRLGNFSDTAFSLQQLLLDLDNAALQSVPTFEGIPDRVQSILESYFVQLWSAAAKEYGAPLIAPTAVPHTTADASQIQMTSFERQASPYKDANGDIVPNPTPGQLAMTTLDRLYMTKNAPLPPPRHIPRN